MNTTQRNLVSAALVVGITFLALAVVLFGRPEKVTASVARTNEYYATTTNASAVSFLVKSGPGSIAQVTITGKNSGLMTLYNATTSDVTQRTGQKATSTIMIADFPANAPEGTYTFDAQFTDGLLLVASGNPATSTITYR